MKPSVSLKAIKQRHNDLRAHLSEGYTRWIEIKSEAYEHSSKLWWLNAQMRNVVPREGAWWYCNRTKTEVQLPAAIKAKLMRQMLVQEKEVWFGCSATWENGGLLPQRAPPLFAMEVHHAIQVMSERERASWERESEQALPWPGIILVWVWGGPGAF